jgi:DNA-binding transcriptional regulator LsrR (DeoR family)
MHRVGLYRRVRQSYYREGKSVRELSRLFGLHRDTIRKMLQFSVPPGYRRKPV